MENKNNQTVICKTDVRPGGFPKTNRIIACVILVICSLLLFVDLDGFQIFLILVAIVYVVFAIFLLATTNGMLILHEKGVSGNVIKGHGFKLARMELPINQVNTISVEHGFLDTLCGGESLVVSTSSGSMRVRCVRNAREVVEKTLTQIQKWQDFQNVTAAPTVSQSSDSIESIQKLKSLLDQGLITQEEYEAKRQELLRKI